MTSPTMICAGRELNKDSSMGDSGDPLIVKKNAAEIYVGTVSRGQGYDVVGEPAIYSRDAIIGRLINNVKE